MDLRYFTVDAFADRPFTGNPAAVMPLDRWLPDALMQSIAAELALSETAFFCAEDGGLRLRWFTPAVEVDLCGHATLASAFVLMTELEPARTEVGFLSRSGRLGVTRTGDTFTLDFPSRPPQPEPDPDLRDQVTAALGKRPRELWRARDLVAVYDGPDDVRRLAPDFARMKTINDERSESNGVGATPASPVGRGRSPRGIGVHGICATAPGGGAGVDFVSRFFAPHQGIDEDPVTGSAHCTLAPMWAQRLNKSQLEARQVSRRGGALALRVAGERVHIGGRAVKVATGALHLPSSI